MAGLGTEAGGPGEWIVGGAEEPGSLDPAWISQVAARQIWLHIFDALVSIEGLGFKTVPMLAESWNRTDDRTWVFKIRKGVKFHNGDDLTAEDVKYSYDIYKLEKSQNRTFLADVTNVEVLDPFTVRMTTRGPSATLLANLNGLSIMPRNAREKAGEEGFARNPVGTGPYKVVEFARGQRLVLEANPTYWRGQVSPKRVTFRLIPDPSTRVAELKTGGVQIIAAPPPARLKELEAGDTELIPLKGARLIIHPFNTKEKPFDDIRLRLAVNYAIDREAIIKNVLEGYGELLHGPFASSWMGYDPALQPYAYNPAKAKQLLAEAGYGNGLETVFSFSSGVFLKDREIAEVVKSQLAQVGITVQLVPTERAKLLADWQNGVFKGITSAAWGTGADPDGMIGTGLYKRPMHQPDDRLNGLIDQSRRAVDPEQRTKVLQELGRYVHEQAYWMFIHAQHEFYAKRKGVGWKPYPINGTFSSFRYYLGPEG